jgi:hypothetical protein
MNSFKECKNNKIFNLTDNLGAQNKKTETFNITFNEKVCENLSRFRPICEGL